MRSSFVTLAVSAGALLLAAITFGGAPVTAAGGCHTYVEAPGTRIFEVERPERGDAPPPETSPQPTPLDHEAEGLAVGDTYDDVFGVLREESSCSRFFGGPRVAVTVFNAFARSLRRKPLGMDKVALAMSGSYTSYQEGRNGASYRLFDEATINSNGPFDVLFPPSGARFRVGRFPAATRAAKTLMLLHELGHLVRGPEGGWLLPNDGSDAALSDRNTRTVESRCIGQLLAIRE